MLDWLLSRSSALVVTAVFVAIIWAVSGESIQTAALVYLICWVIAYDGRQIQRWMKS